MAKSNETRAAPEVERSASQIMFGHLPEQTVDINRGVWKVIRWRDPRIERGVDAQALRIEVLRQATPWSELGRDSGLAVRLAGGRRTLKVLSLARDRGIEAESFPKLWLCPRCKKVHRTGSGNCNCGFIGPRDQIHFVCYCADCGTLSEPPIARCQTHGEPRILFPGTMAADQIVQDCPQCGRILRRGFVGRPCPSCRQPMTPQVHRSASVYNPPERGHHQSAGSRAA